jgi:diacylglycerol kinase (ATP)
LSKRAKDIGSAAVMISLLNVVVVWALVLAG